MKHLTISLLLALLVLGGCSELSRCMKAHSVEVSHLNCEVIGGPKSSQRYIDCLVADKTELKRMEKERTKAICHRQGIY